MNFFDATSPRKKGMGRVRKSREKERERERERERGTELTNEFEA